jgi:hypothetical protein
MPDFHVRADAVNVEQIMEQIRARIREKRGADYTEEQIRELANVKLEKFLDPRAVRSDLVEQWRRLQTEKGPLTFEFGEETLYESHRAPIVRAIRRMLQPVLKLFFNPNPLIRALHIQSQVNARQELQFELLHNLVLEVTRLGIEVKNLRLRVESMTGRLEFNERRARALESLVMYRPEVEAELAKPVHRPAPPAPPPPMPRPSAPADAGSDRGSTPETAPPGAPQAEGPGQRSRRRRRRRGRRGPPASVVMGGAAPSQPEGAPGEPDGMAGDNGDADTGPGEGGPGSADGSSDPDGSQ